MKRLPLFSNVTVIKRGTGEGERGTGDRERVRENNKVTKELEKKLPLGLGFKLAFVSKFAFFPFLMLVPRGPAPCTPPHPASRTLPLHPAPRGGRGEGQVKRKMVSFLSSKEMSSGVFRAFVKIRTESNELLAVRNKILKKKASS